jgi:hypothetical protein
LAGGGVFMGGRLLRGYRIWRLEISTQNKLVVFDDQYNKVHTFPVSVLFAKLRISRIIKRIEHLPIPPYIP